jgi:sporulation integral membrane protein YlbJ
VPGRTGLLLQGLAATLLCVALVLYPDLAFRSALRGLRIWWDVVFPALLPFFVAGQVLMALGVVHALGVLLERLMRPVFNVPGVGAFVLAMGLASGYPIGAVLTARLRRDGQLNEAEAERLLSFCNTADPLFMAGAVAVGMFGRPELAGGIMACHYLAALGTGLVLRFHRAGERSPDPVPATGRSLWARAADAMVEARVQDGRPFGQVLGDAVRESISTLLMVGGLIILFAVLIDLLRHVGAVQVLATVLAWALHPLGVNRAVAEALVSGLFEITIGVQAASHAMGGLLPRLVVTNGIIAWSGLSVLAQVAAVTQGTGIRLGPYVFARAVQAVLAAALTFWFWNPAWTRVPLQPVMAPLGTFHGTLDHSLLVLIGVALVALVAVAVLWRAWGGRALWMRVRHR